MSTDLARYEVTSPAPVALRDYQSDAVRRLGEWAESASAAFQIAERLVQTSFVPAAFRGKPVEAAAAILAGVEVGLQPMAALRSFDVISGQAAARAITLRAVSYTHLDVYKRQFQVLTKRPARMRALLSSRSFWTAVARRVGERYDAGDGEHPGWAWSGGESAIDYLDNVWLGVSVEDQETANLRITALLNTPAAVRWLSCEPLLGPVSLPICRCLGMGSIAHGRHIPDTVCDECEGSGSPIDWVVVGGESGPGARPMHPSWALSLRDQCVAASVPFLFKQWGEWKPTERLGACLLYTSRCV